MVKFKGFAERLKIIKSLFLDEWSAYIDEYNPSSGIKTPWAKGERLPSGKHLHGMAKNGIDVNWLLTGVDPRAGPEACADPSSLPQTAKEKELIRKTLNVLRANGKGKQIAEALESNINAFDISVNLIKDQANNRPRGKGQNVDALPPKSSYLKVNT